MFGESQLSADDFPAGLSKGDLMSEVWKGQSQEVCGCEEQVEPLGAASGALRVCLSIFAFLSQLLFQQAFQWEINKLDWISEILEFIKQA